MAESNEILLHNLAMTTMAIKSTLAPFGMALNLSKGKTEAVIELCGSQSASLQAAMAYEDEGGQSVARLPLLDGSHLRLVRSYRHLGTIAAPSVVLSAEYGARTINFKAAWEKKVGHVVPRGTLMGFPSLGPPSSHRC